MNHLSEAKIQILIDSVAKRPFIYNKKHEKYKDMEYKEKAWREIAQNVNVNERSCKLAWRSMKDQFFKSIKMKRKGKKYKHFERLVFLMDTISVKGENSTFQFDEDTVLDESPIVMESVPGFVFETCASQTMKPSSSDNESELSAPFEVIPPPPSKKPSIREKDNLSSSFDNVLSELALRTVSKEPDSVELFFKSVANTVKSYSLSNSELAILQCEVLNFVTERLEQIRNGNSLSLSH